MKTRSSSQSHKQKGKQVAGRQSSLAAIRERNLRKRAQASISAEMEGPPAPKRRRLLKEDTPAESVHSESTNRTVVDRPLLPTTRNSASQQSNQPHSPEQIPRVPALGSLVATATVSATATEPHLESTQGSAATAATQVEDIDRRLQSGEVSIDIVRDHVRRRLTEFDELVENHRVRQQKAQSDLAKREKEIERREKEFSRKSANLAKKEESLQKREKQINELMLNLCVDRGEQALHKLDDMFQCELCLDVLAAPYTMVPEKCGHTFCSLCILQYYLGKFHDDCCKFHQPMDCPKCRTVLPWPNAHHKRASCSCPFTPNRLADGVIEQHVEVLTASAQELHNIAKANKKGGRLVIPDTPIVDWREKGRAKIAWKARYDQGKAEMLLLTERWKTIGGDDIIMMKRRLGIANLREEDL
ncbi:hypothetical protein CERSUDRAFT_104393 [Gelatoporia subvermispora B]|uniref:RING-type domain-containing protein n=1 Tax=Ceriporiopsis subvermispora (strain B) TaxID=914234 RepID=M2RJZ0_CERS8|nr:hypothetical protein CERSUDRAFT_104393 [Gelatoporia subvermispora B]